MNDQVLWFTTRGAGVVTLLLLTATVAMGLLARLRVESPSWPRFLSAAFHRDLALMTLIFLALHVITAIVDPFTSLGIVPLVVPFGSPYRRIWLGLGTVALLLLVAVILTNALRPRVGRRAWGVIHGAGYLAWPVAVLHGAGTGTDARSIWSLTLTVACVTVIGGLLGWRLVAAPSDPLREARRTAVASHRLPR